MKINKKSLFKRLAIARALWKSIREFLSTTYVHAYHYLVDIDRRLPEKIMWSIFHLIMLSASMNIVLIAWSRFTDNPTITTLESQHYSIYNLNFPAIAICPNNKLSRKAVEEYADYL
jgi:amiloride-sensitive sodium channel